MRLCVKEWHFRSVRCEDSSRPLPLKLPPLHLITATEEGWRTLLAVTAAGLLTKLRGGEQDVVVAELEGVAADLHAGQWSDAVQRLCTCMSSEAGISTFELLNSCVVGAMAHAIREAKSNLIQDVVFPNRNHGETRNPSEKPTTAAGIKP